MAGQRRREKSVSQGRRHGQARYFGILRSIEFITRILLDQFPQQLSREGSLIFTAPGKGKDDFGEGAQITTVLRSPGDLFHAELFVAVNSIKPEREAGTCALRSDNVVCYAKGYVSVGRVRIMPVNTRHIC